MILTIAFGCMSQASKLKVAAFPIVGAVIGAAVAGPFGLVAGAKIGGLAGAVGGITGFSGGQLLKKRHNKVVNMELQNLEDRSTLEGGVQRSTSTPELSSPPAPTPTQDVEQSESRQEESNTFIFSNLFPWRLRQMQSQSDE